jgi:hypothetical protein
MQTLPHLFLVIESVVSVWDQPAESAFESVAKVAAEEDPDDDIATSYKTMLDAIVSKRNQWQKSRKSKAS